ncbi:MAG: methyltransferase domain-containing protein [Limnohabitans sp.]|nr:methyltransferase domain-containing protein [Limnohabitans sp.]
MTTAAVPHTMKPRNPHFDDDLVVWDDAYSGRYEGVAYDEQFDDQWRLFLEGRTGFHTHTGVETTDEYIDDRIAELTGVRDYLWRKRWGAMAPMMWVLTGRSRRQERRGVGGRLILEPKFPVQYFEGKRCLDAGCGAGRWTKTLASLGANMKSLDVSKHGLESTRRFNTDAEKLSLFDIPTRPDLQSAFDFTICWGVVMCTHDPRRAFEAVAGTVRPGGQLYLFVYAPTYHASEKIVRWRKEYHATCHTFEQKLDFAYRISDRPENCINQLDMLNTLYNWTIPLEVAEKWFTDAGFTKPVLLNAKEVPACGHHLLGTKLG